jgi:hypothetical protein
MDGPAVAGSIGPMMSPRTLLLLAAALSAGCATARRPASPATAAAPVHHANEVAAKRAIDAARSLAGQKEIVLNGVRYGDGCSALVVAAYQQAGRKLSAGPHDVKSLHALARSERSLRKGQPAPGDLVFLSDRPGGLPEHVGLVERVGAGGTVTVLHRTARGVSRMHVNGLQPWKARDDDGQILNDVLVVGGGRVPAGRLLVAYATLL